MLVVRLDDPRYGAGPGTVIAHVSSAREYNERFHDRDGARDPALRLWEGEGAIGERVKMKQYTDEEWRAQCAPGCSCSVSHMPDPGCRWHGLRYKVQS